MWQWCFGGGSFLGFGAEGLRLLVLLVLVSSFLTWCVLMWWLRFFSFLNTRPHVSQENTCKKYILKFKNLRFTFSRKYLIFKLKKEFRKK